MAIVAIGVVFAACSKGRETPAPAPASGGAPAPQSGGTASSLPAAASKLTDACPLIPKDAVQRLVPNANPPESERYPLRCTVRNDKSAIAITLAPGEPPNPQAGEPVSGIADGGIVERLDPKSKGDVYLTVSLGKDNVGLSYNLNVEVSGHDGADHKDDALAIARDVVAHLR